jgi:hypothetical protein
MAYIVRDLPPLKTATSSGGASNTNVIGSLDNANSITLFFTSSFSGTTTTATLHVTQYDPAIPLQSGVSQSTGFYNLSTALITSSGMALTLSNISFRGLQVTGFTATSSASGEIIAYASAQISV